MLFMLFAVLRPILLLHNDNKHSDVFYYCMKHFNAADRRPEKWTKTTTTTTTTTLNCFTYYVLFNLERRWRTKFATFSFKKIYIERRKGKKETEFDVWMERWTPLLYFFLITFTQHGLNKRIKKRSLRLAWPFTEQLLPNTDDMTGRHIIYKLPLFSGAVSLWHVLRLWLRPRRCISRTENRGNSRRRKGSGGEGWPKWGVERATTLKIHKGEQDYAVRSHKRTRFSVVQQSL